MQPAGEGKHSGQARRKWREAAKPSAPIPMNKAHADGSGTVTRIWYGPFELENVPELLLKYSPETPGPEISGPHAQDAEVPESTRPIQYRVFAASTGWLLSETV